MIQHNIGDIISINIENGLSTGKGKVIAIEPMNGFAKKSYLVELIEQYNLDWHGVVDNKVWINDFEVNNK